MAHESTDIVLGDGLNVLVGPNNVGKSTVAYAIKLVARNANSSFVMRHDSKECSVTIETAENHTITWCKRKSPSYVINGAVKDRLGRGGTPPELDETLRLAPVVFEDTDFEPHFGEQKSPIFLINRSPGHIAQFFSTTSDAERLVAMQRLHQKRRAEAAAQSKVLESQNDALSKSLAALADVPELSEDLKRLNELHAMLEQVDREIEQLDHYLALWTECWLAEQRKRMESQVLADLRTPPEQFSVTALQLHITHWLDAWHSAWKSELDADTLRVLGPVPILDETLPLEKSLQGIRHFRVLVDHQSEMALALTGLAVMPDLLPTDGLQQAILRWEMSSIRCEQLDNASRVYNGLVSPPPVHDVDSLGLLLEAVQSQLQVSEMLNQLSDDVARDKQRFETALNEALVQNPVCSSCGTPWTAEMVRLGKGHWHQLSNP
jgi:exonuclease SbcC